MTSDILIVLGEFDLDSNFEIEREIRYPSKIYIHPDWNPQHESFDADIALIKFENAVSFSNYIQPVCLWESSNNPPQTSGVVVGYGSEDKTKIHENIPKVINVPIQTQEKCFSSNPGLVQLSSNRTFCVGNRDGTGVCKGDGGGGLVIQSGNVFYLRGIVSTLLLNDNHECDLNNYAIFTNVLKFKDWIKSFMWIKIARHMWFFNFNSRDSQYKIIWTSKFALIE